MRRIAVLIVGLMLMVAPASALAQGSSTCQGYSPQTAGVVGSNGSTGNGACTQNVDATRTVSTVSQGTLPFTGLDISLLIAGSLVLLGAGLVVRRFSRRLE